PARFNDPEPKAASQRATKYADKQCTKAVAKSLGRQFPRRGRSLQRIRHVRTPRFRPRVLAPREKMSKGRIGVGAAEGYVAYYALRRQAKSRLFSRFFIPRSSAHGVPCRVSVEQQAKFRQRRRPEPSRFDAGDVDACLRRRRVDASGLQR